MTPLVGRQPELAYAVRALEDGATLVVAGTGGIGKTRLITAIGDEVGTRGWVVHRAAGTLAAPGLPPAAIAHLIPVKPDPSARQLILVDDAHLLDEASASTLAQLARDEHVALAVSVRSGEFLPEAIAELFDDTESIRIELQALSEREVGQLLALLLGGRTDRATVHTLWETTRGNALFLRELVGDALTRGLITEADDTWVLRGELTIGPSLHDLIAGRLRHLAPDEREVLETIAISEPTPMANFVGVAGARVLGTLTQSGLVEVRPDGQRRAVFLSHPLYGEVVRAAIPAGRAATLRIALADEIEAHGGRRRDDRLRVASLRVAAGSPVAPAALVAAAWEARAAHDPALVERLVTMALRSGPDAEATFLLGAALLDRGRYREAVATWDSLVDQPCPDELRALLATVRAALSVPTGDKGDIEVAPGAETGPAVDEAPVWAWIASARDRITAGRLETVLDEAAAVDIRAEQTGAGVALPMLSVRSCRVFALLAAGRLDSVESVLTSDLESAVTDPRPTIYAHVVEVLGLVALARGDLEAAETHLSDAVATFRISDNGGLRPALLELALVSAMRGDEHTMSALLAEARRAQVTTVEPLVAEIRVRAAFLAGEGSSTAACALLREHVADARAAGPLFELPVLHDLARYGAAESVVARLVELAAAFDGVLASLYRDQAVAITGRDGAALLDVATRFEVLGFSLDAAESVAAAAAALRTAGKSAAASAATERASGLAAACEGARTPLLAFLGRS